MSRNSPGNGSGPSFPRPSNRKGARVNGQRCEELFIQVSGNLIILLRAMVRLASISVTIPRSSRNVARRKNNKTNYPHLASLPVETLRFASLGSSYIEPCSLQRDWRRGRPDATVASGRLNLAFFFSPRDSALADACRIGLRFDVLSAKLEQEHTGGVHCMQVAFNVPAHAAMLVHEMQIVKQLAEVCTSASDVTGEVRLESHPRVSSPKAFLARPQARSCPCCSLLWIRWRLVLSKAAYGCLASALRDGWIDYFGPQHMNNISSKLAKAFALAQKLAARFQGEFCLSPLGHDNFSTQQLPDSYTQWCT